MICVTYERPKFAALIFDHVLPVPSLGKIEATGAEPAKFLKDFHDKFYDSATVPEVLAILPPQVTDSYLTGAFAFSLVESLFQQGEEQIKNYLDIWRARPTDDFANLFAAIAERYIEASDRRTPWRSWLQNTALSKIEQFEILGTSELVELNDVEPSPFIQLSNFPVIDESQLTWQQVLEIRRNPLATQRLRRFRAFVAADYANMTKQHIEDDLVTRISDFEDEAREHGLTTTRGIFEVGGSEELASAFTTGLLATFAGAPPTLAAAIGASTVLAGMLVQIVTRRKQFEIRQQKNPIRYLIDIRQSSKKR